MSHTDPGPQNPFSDRAPMAAVRRVDALPGQEPLVEVAARNKPCGSALSSSYSFDGLNMHLVLP